jgi:hypothetical protein
MLDSQLDTPLLMPTFMDRVILELLHNFNHFKSSARALLDQAFHNGLALSTLS